MKPCLFKTEGLVPTPNSRFLDYADRFTIGSARNDREQNEVPEGHEFSCPSRLPPPKPGLFWRLQLQNPPYSTRIRAVNQRHNLFAMEAT